MDSLVVPEQFVCDRIQELIATPNDSFLTSAIKKAIQRQLQSLSIQAPEVALTEIEIASTPPGLSSDVHGLLCSHQYGRSLVTVQRGKYAGNLHPLESYQAVALFR